MWFSMVLGRPAASPLPLAGLLLAALLATCAASGSARAQQQRQAEPFRSRYDGEHARGDHVLALWQFDPHSPEADRSGNGHTLTLNGAEFVSDGRFGGALKAQRGWPDVDQPHQGRVANSPDLTPSGAFTIELWIQPSEQLRDYGQAYLIDKKYVSDDDYQLVLGRESASDTRRLQMQLGFGTTSETWVSDPLSWPAGRWRHIAFTYDGAGGGAFIVDGSPAGEDHKPGLASISAGRRPLVLGDRGGSYYYGFPGLIDQVRISRGVLRFNPVDFQLLSTRRVFERMEAADPLQLVVTNLTDAPLVDAAVTLQLTGGPHQESMLPPIEPGQSHQLELPLDTALRPDTYRLTATVSLGGDQPFSSHRSFDLLLVPRQPPGRMPVVMWGSESGRRERLREIGFTHTIGLRCDMAAVWEAGEPTLPGSDEAIASGIAQLDDALAAGMRVVSSLSPGAWARGKRDFQRVDRDGNPFSERADVSASFDRIVQFGEHVGRSMAQTYGAHPAFDAALIHSEVRGHAKPSFHPHERDAFEQASGMAIPEQVETMRGVHRRQLDDFPEDGVIRDDYPLYVYYKWLWKQGDGWNDLHTAVHRGLKASAHDRFWTFHDPAVRAASLWGSGGQVDYLSQWTYSYPDPLRIGLATDELFQMASAQPDQRVMKMTQVIWYRSQTAPEPGERATEQTADFDDQDRRPRGTGSVDAEGRYRAWWEEETPEARFITIAPLHLRQALWTKIARPIQGIMYHGIGSLLPQLTHGSYRHTHPQTEFELQRLIRDLVEPLGPTLLSVPDADKDVAFLESFAAEMFAGRGTYGWNGSWAGEMWLICQYAALRPEVVFEETISERGLDRYKVLVMPDCDVLPASVVEAVLEFQQRGGIVVGDGRLTPAIEADFSVAVHPRSRQADEARQMNIDKALELRRQLDAAYRRDVDSSTPDVVPYLRRYKSTDYLFAVNDAREFGNYVGHHGLVMEDGLPSDTQLTLARGGYVYDLVARRQVASSDGQTLRLQRHFGPGEGQLLMVTAKPIDSVRIEAPQRAAAGDSVEIVVEVVDADGEPLDAVVPIRFDLQDPHGRQAEWSGYYGAEDGRLRIRADLASNDTPGLWRITASELASGTSRDAYLRVDHERRENQQ